MLNNLNKQKGFTLVELAIVLVIVGLLIGGILKGQKLLLNSKVTATVAQIRGIEAAVTNFRDVYGGIPGDLKNSDVKIQGCDTPVDATYCDTNADGAVGADDWDMQTYQPAVDTDGVEDGTGLGDGKETLLFWYSLQQAGLISGITSEIVDTGTPQQAFGKTVPAAKIAGGFWAGNSLNGTLGRNTGQYTLFGSIITLSKMPSTSLAFGSQQGVTTPAIAANIDRKLDDGLPASGTIQAYGLPLSCFGGSNASDNSYTESVTNLDCGLHIRVQK